LELAQLVEDNGVAQVDVWRRRVDAQLDPQRPTLTLSQRELLLQPTLRQHFNCSYTEIFDEAAISHGSVSPFPASAKRG
jgi:hypothetical protein